jgi:hypothetical protein
VSGRVDMAMARHSVSKQLGVLDAANLVTSLWSGREKLRHLNAAPMNEVSDRWTDSYDKPRVHALTELKQGLENPRCKRPRSSMRLHPDHARPVVAGADRAPVRFGRIAGVERPESRRHLGPGGLVPTVLAHPLIVAFELGI